MPGISIEGAISLRRKGFLSIAIGELLDIENLTKLARSSDMKFCLAAPVT